MNVIKSLKFVFDVFVKDFSSLGSLAGYLFICVIFFAIGYTDLSLKILIGLFFSYAVIILIRSLYHKDRPKKQKSDDFITKIDSSSFPSAHATRVTILLLLIVFSLENYLLWAIFLGLFVGVCFSRIYLKRHYLIDIIGGIFLGTLISSGIIYFI